VYSVKISYIKIPEKWGHQQYWFLPKSEQKKSLLQLSSNEFFHSQNARKSRHPNHSALLMDPIWSQGATLWEEGRRERRRKGKEKKKGVEEKDNFTCTS